MIHVVIIGDWE